MKVLIRTDASLNIGSGHVMRCLCLADVLHASGASVSFASINLPDQLAMLIEKHGHELIRLPVNSVESEMEDATLTTVHGRNCDLVVVDHYALGVAWESMLRAHARVLAIDDLAREHNCDWLLDQNFHPFAEQRYTEKVPDDCIMLLGPRFALLRQEFLDARQRIAPRNGAARRLLVFLGGMDADNVTSDVLQAIDLADCPELAVDVIIGASQPARQHIESWCARRGNGNCYIQAENMAALFAAADLAIGAGGTATWERCSVGLPTLALCLAENQRDLLYQGSRYGFVYAPDCIANDIASITLHIRALLANDGLRSHLSQVGYDLVDAKGTQRVVAALQTARIEMRLATNEDAESLYSWRNDPKVRAVSRNNNVIPYEQHKLWLAGVLASSARHLLIGERDGQAIGVLRFDIEGDAAEVSIYLTPERIGQGEGSALLLAGEAWLRRAQPEVRVLNAYVNANNGTSERLFERCGYNMLATQYIKRI